MSLFSPRGDLAIVTATLVALAGWSQPSWADVGTAADAKREKLLQRASEWKADDDEKVQQAFLADLRASCGKEQLSKQHEQFGQQMAQHLSQWSDSEAAAQAFDALGEAFAQLEGKNAVRTAQHYQGIARRLRLVGKELELVGTFLDGKKFDWADYEGKVVLVELWSTTCGPCIAIDMPKVAEEYRLYHDKGLEVIGVSLDKDEEAVKKFVADRKIPWPILCDGPWESSSFSQRYGVEGIPMKFLVGKDGKVVAVNPDDLPTEMEKLLGKVEGRKAEMTQDEQMARLREAYGITSEMMQKALEQALEAQESGEQK